MLVPKPEERVAPPCFLGSKVLMVVPISVVLSSTVSPAGARLASAGLVGIAAAAGLIELAMICVPLDIWLLSEIEESIGCLL